jgi:imidazolonepropionase-like amidohydrolase
VAIAGGKIAAVAAHIDPADARMTVNAAGIYVTPGLVDAELRWQSHQYRETFTPPD